MSTTVNLNKSVGKNGTVTVMVKHTSGARPANYASVTTPEGSHGRYFDTMAEAVEYADLEFHKHAARCVPEAYAEMINREKTEAHTRYRWYRLMEKLNAESYRLWCRGNHTATAVRAFKKNETLIGYQPCDKAQEALKQLRAGMPLAAGLEYVAAVECACHAGYVVNDLLSMALTEDQQNG